MIFSVGNEAFEDFVIINEIGDLMTGIDSTAFTSFLFDPDGLERTNLINITPLSNGHYRISFIPDKRGFWTISIFHKRYFPFGKSGSLKISNNTIDDIYLISERILGLNQENFFIDNPQYDENFNLTFSRVRTYKNKNDVGTNSNILAEYEMTAEYDENGMMSEYKMVKI